MWTSFALAACLLTNLPALTFDSPTRPAARRAIALLPLVGGLVGLGLAAVWTLASRLWAGQEMAIGAFVLLAGAAATGGRGLGGLARAGDGLAAHESGGDRARAFAVMRDPRRGTAGLVALVVAVILRFALLSSLPPAVAWPGLVLISILGGWAVAFAYAAFPLASMTGDAPETGHGLADAGPNEFVVATVFAILAVALLPGRGLLVLLAVALVVGPLASHVNKTLGGLSRPLCAALGEVAELAALACLCVR